MKRIILGIIILCASALAQQEKRAKPGTIWIQFEEQGMEWMIGAPKGYALSNPPLDPPSKLVKIQTHQDTLIFNDCCFTNIILGTNISVTIQIGTNFYKVIDLTTSKHS